MDMLVAAATHQGGDHTSTANAKKQQHYLLQMEQEIQGEFSCNSHG